MKTLKFAVIALFVAFTMASLANADKFTDRPGKIKPIKAVSLTMEKAAQIPGLVAAMYAQLDRDDFLNNPQQYYVARVFYKSAIYRISGTYDQWYRFFKIKGDLPVKCNRISVITD